MQKKIDWEGMQKTIGWEGMQKTIGWVGMQENSGSNHCINPEYQYMVLR